MKKLHCLIIMFVVLVSSCTKEQSKKTASQYELDSMEAVCIANGMNEEMMNDIYMLPSDTIKHDTLK